MTNRDFFEIEKLIFNFECIKKYCFDNQNEANSNLLKNCDQLLESVIVVNKIAYEFIYENIPSNGFLTFLRIVKCFTDLIITQSKTKIDPNLIKLFKLLFFYNEWLMDTYNVLKRENSKNDKNNQSFLKKEICLSSRLSYELIHANLDVLPLVFSTYEAFWLPKEVQKILKFLSFQVALAYKLPFSLSSIWSDEATGRNCVNAFFFATLEYPFNLWHLIEKYGIAKLLNGLVNRKIPVKSITLNIEKQKKFRLDYKGNILDFEKMTKDEIDNYNNDKEEQKRQNSPGLRHRNHETIKCRYSFILGKDKVIESLERIKIKKESMPISNRAGHHSVHILPDNYMNQNIEENKNPNENNILLIYIHGGAFFTQGSHSSEIYLRKIVNQLGGIPILSIDYSLTVPYPIPLQEILDVYLWALSGQDEVKEKLGFYPKKIILSGDSCGGYFCITLSIVLNELNKIKNKTEKNCDTNGLIRNHLNSLPIPLPLAIVAAYPAFTVSNLSPAKTVQVLDPILEIHLCMLGISFFGPYLLTNEDYKKIENSEKYQKIVAKNKDKIVEEGKIFEISKDSSKLWFNCDYRTFRDRADYIATFYDHPFINPVQYRDKFEELKEIALYSLTGREDFFSDEAIEMVRIWHGKKSLDIFDHVIHGFFQFNFLSPDTENAFNVAITRYQQACNLLPVATGI